MLCHAKRSRCPGTNAEARRRGPTASVRRGGNSPLNPHSQQLTSIRLERSFWEDRIGDSAHFATPRFLRPLHQLPPAVQGYHEAGSKFT